MKLLIQANTHMKFHALKVFYGQTFLSDVIEKHRSNFSVTCLFNLMATLNTLNQQINLSYPLTNFEFLEFPTVPWMLLSLMCLPS